MSDMNDSDRKNRRRIIDLGVRAAGCVALAVVMSITAGCKRDARLADADLREPVVADVTLAGLNLDQNATPRMVTYALLQAIREDLEAGRDLEARERAFDQQFALAAPAAIHAQHQRAVGAEHADLQESVYRTVRAWAPTLGHYVGSFDFPFEEAEERMRVRMMSSQRTTSADEAGEAHVMLEAEDPEGDPGASVVVKVRLLREKQRWRVWWVGFERTIRRLPSDG